MTIARTDLKLRASQRMSDAADGGGAMTAVVVTDSTAVFDNISETARLKGHWSCRKLFASIENADGTPFLGAQVMLDSRPNDDQSSILLFRSSAWDDGVGAAQERPAVVSEMAGELASNTDGGPQWYGSRSITAAASAGSTTVQLSSVYSRIVPVEPTDTPVSGAFTVAASYAHTQPLPAEGLGLVINLDLMSQGYTWVPGANNYRIVTLGHAAIEKSVLVTWVDIYGVPQRAIGGTQAATLSGTALSMYLYPEPQSGSTVTIQYSRGDQIVIAPEVLMTQEQLTDGHALTVPPGTAFRGGFIHFIPYGTDDGYRIDALTGMVWRHHPGGAEEPAGTYDVATGILRVPGYDAAGGATGYFCFVKPQTGGAASRFTAQVVAGMVPSSIEMAYGAESAAADAAGVIVGAGVTGRYSPGSGLIELQFDPPWAGAMTWSGAKRTSQVVDDLEVHPFAAAAVPPSGNVRVLREGDIVVVHNTQQLSARNVVAGEVVSCGRTALAQIRIIGSDGVEIPPSAGWVENLTAGTATVTSTTAWPQPVVIEHRVEDAAILTDVSGTSLATLSRPLTHAYPAGTSWMSRPMLLGDRRAAVQDGWALTTWTGNWDAVGPAPDDALYAQALYPIVVTNQGAASEDWALVFTSSTAYYVLGRTLGVIAFGNTAADCSPINPATAAAYFTVKAVGWGTGWSAGNAWRFSTSGTAVPFWAVRCVSPRDLSDVEQRAVIVLRGSV